MADQRVQRVPTVQELMRDGHPMASAQIISNLAQTAVNLSERVTELTDRVTELTDRVAELEASLSAAHGAIRVAGAAASNSAATNKVAADQNFPWYVPYLKMTCREQAAHVSCRYLH